MEGRTVVGTTDRHRPFSEIQSMNFVTKAAGRTAAGTKGRHKLRNPDWVEFLLNVLRGVLDYSSYNYTSSGLM